MAVTSVRTQPATGMVFGWSHRVWGWCGPIAVTLLALALRVRKLGRPEHLQFDETYYAKDGWSMLQYGYPRDAIERADDRIIAGRLDGIFTTYPEQFVHPPAGKWLIAVGERIFGMNAFGWRVSAAVIGALMVLILARIVLRLTGSVVMGCLAALVLSLDGLHFVMSRLALLDIFLAFWLLCAVACLIADRDWIAIRLERWRPWRPWQLAAGVCFGLACATKWSGIYPLAAFGLAIVGWEVFARYRASRNAGTDSAWRGWIGTTLSVGAPAFVLLVVVGFVVYIATWSSWLWHYQVFADRFGRGYNGNPAWGAWLDESRGSFAGHLIDAVRSLWHYHIMTYDFHTGSYLKDQSHTYQSNPAGWLILNRPVGVDAQNDLPAASCGTSSDSMCIREVLLLGNPVVWWSGAAALIAGVVAWFRSRDWRIGWPLLAVAACWLPWFAYADRPVFSFYAVAALPFTIIVMSVLVHTITQSAPTPRSRYFVWLVVGGWTVGVVIAFWFFYPILTDSLISHDAWLRRIWFSSWV